MDGDIVITGAGAVTSLGLNPSDTWNSLMEGKTGLSRITEFDPEGFPCRYVAIVSGLDGDSLNMRHRDARIMNRHAFMLLKASEDACGDAELDNAGLGAGDIGFFAGMGMVDYETEDLLPAIRSSLRSDGGIDYERFYSEGFRESYPLWPLSMLNNISFCMVAIRLGICGANTVFSPHADSTFQAVTEGIHLLLDNGAGAVIAGGVSEKITPSGLARMLIKGVLNTSDEQPQKCRPFSSERQGALPGEGAGAVVLETLSGAEKRGVTPLVRVSGYGYGFGLDGGLYPDPGAIAASMEGAMTMAGVGPGDIDLVIAHGDGTPGSDGNEAEALNSLFAGPACDVMVFSSKGALGNMLAGSAAVDVVMALRMLQEGVVPPTLNSGDPDGMVRFRISDKPARIPLNRVMINALSYEGQAATLMVEKLG